MYIIRNKTPFADRFYWHARNLYRSQQWWTIDMLRTNISRIAVSTVHSEKSTYRKRYAHGEADNLVYWWQDHCNNNKSRI